jgi:hypothetical protein
LTVTSKALARAGVPPAPAVKNATPALVPAPKAPAAPAAVTPTNEAAPTTGLSGADFLAETFLRSLHVLVTATRLYRRGHPRIAESLESAERNLRAALRQRPSIDVRIESTHLSLLSPSLKHENRTLADPRGELRTFTVQLSDAGVNTLTFLPKTNFGELELFARAVDATSRIAAQQRATDAAGRRNWSSWLIEHQICGIRVNTPAQRQEEDTVLAILLGALPSDSQRGTAPRFPPSTLEQLHEALKFLSAATPHFAQAQQQPVKDAAQLVRSELAAAGEPTIELIKFGMAKDPPQQGDTTGSYCSRLSRTLVVNFALAEHHAGRMSPLDVRPLLTQLNQYGAAGGEEAEIEVRAELFWSALPAREKARVLGTSDAWCLPVPVLRGYIEPLIEAAQRKGAEASGREARRALADFARCVRSEEAKARRTTAAALVELAGQVDRLWPHPRFAEMAGSVVEALLAETSPGIAGLLAAATETLARLALERGDYTEFGRILDGLARAPRDADHEAITALSRRIVAQDRWLVLVDTALANRSLDPALPKLLRRDPERLLDRLGLLLTTAEGADSFPAMARLVRAAGEPVLGALESHLSQPRQQRIATAIRLLSAVAAERLVRALPRAFPGWDWGLQDLAITELARQSQPPLQAQIAQTFLEMLTEAHFYVMPSMLDHIARVGDGSAAPRLMEIAEGKVDVMRDLFVRIKAIETIGHLRAESAAPMLRELLRSRSGMTYLEPSGLRSAAEEALALIENHPSSVQLRAAKEALMRQSAHFERPRRYLRFRLPSPLAAKIEGPHEAEATVHVIAMGGALIETGQPLAIGETIRVEIRAGLRRFRATSVIRNATAQGYGIEFMHMKQEDRERLRRYLLKLQR